MIKARSAPRKKIVTYAQQVAAEREAATWHRERLRTARMTPPARTIFGRTPTSSPSPLRRALKRGKSKG